MTNGYKKLFTHSIKWRCKNLSNRTFVQIIDLILGFMTLFSSRETFRYFIVFTKNNSEHDVMIDTFVNINE
ncbi:MAG: hypothetical protein CMH46_05025 [Muricauda sp.]|nr:hypothetical protein [Allomuricauda sp.]